MFPNKKILQRKSIDFAFQDRQRNDEFQSDIDMPAFSNSQIHQTLLFLPLLLPQRKPYTENDTNAWRYPHALPDPLLPCAYFLGEGVGLGAQFPHGVGCSEGQVWRRLGSGWGEQLTAWLSRQHSRRGQYSRKAATLDNTCEGQGSRGIWQFLCLAPSPWSISYKRSPRQKHP